MCRPSSADSTATSATCGRCSTPNTAAPRGLSDNERRRATYLRVLDDAVPNLDPARRVPAAAALQLLVSAASWESLRDYWDLEGDAAVAAVQQAIVAMLDGLRHTT